MAQLHIIHNEYSDYDTLSEDSSMEVTVREVRVTNTASKQVAIETPYQDVEGTTHYVKLVLNPLETSLLISRLSQQLYAIGLRA